MDEIEKGVRMIHIKKVPGKGTKAAKRDARTNIDEEMRKKCRNTKNYCQLKGYMSVVYMIILVFIHACTLRAPPLG